VSVPVPVPVLVPLLSPTIFWLLRAVALQRQPRVRIGHFP
jgi:hypothetical protein